MKDTDRQAYSRIRIYIMYMCRSQKLIHLCSIFIAIYMFLFFCKLGSEVTLHVLSQCKKVAAFCPVHPVRNSQGFQVSPFLMYFPKRGRRDVRTAGLALGLVHLYTYNVRSSIYKVENLNFLKMNVDEIVRSDKI